MARKVGRQKDRQPLYHHRAGFFRQRNKRYKAVKKKAASTQAKKLRNAHRRELDVSASQLSYSFASSCAGGGGLRKGSGQGMDKKHLRKQSTGFERSNPAGISVSSVLSGIRREGVCRQILLLPFHHMVDVHSFASSLKRTDCVRSQHRGRQSFGDSDDCERPPLDEAHDCRRDSVLPRAEDQRESQAAGDWRSLRLRYNAKCEFRFVWNTNFRNLLSCLDAAKATDMIVALFSSATLDNPAFDDTGYQLLTSLRCQGLPPIVGVCCEPAESLATRTAKAKTLENRKLVSRYFFSELGADKKFFAVTLPSCDAEPLAVSAGVPSSATETSVSKLLRCLANLSPRELTWRKGRGYMLADKVCTATEEGGTIAAAVDVYGYVSGAGFCVNYPVHVTGVGDFVVSEIREPFRKGRGEQETTGRILAQQTEATWTELKEECHCLRPYDSLHGEQTWPTSAELHVAAADRTSSISEESEGNAGDDSEDADDQMETEDRDFPTSDEESLAECSSQKGAADNSDASRKKRIELIERSKEDMMFPDEIDTPTDRPARERFAKYRGLKSFRTSSWDPYENLPLEYSRIYDFESYNATHQFARATYQTQCDAVDDGRGTAGRYVCLRLTTAREMEMQIRQRQHAAATQKRDFLAEDGQDAEEPRRREEQLLMLQRLLQTHPLVLSSVLPCELKVSVLHLNLLRIGSQSTAPESNSGRGTVEEKMSRSGHGDRRDMDVEGEEEENQCAEEDRPLESKQTVELHCGFRRFAAKPIYSQTLLVGKLQNKAKYQRFFRTGSPVVASVYAPTIFPACPVLMTSVSKDNKSGSLLAWGSVLGSNPNQLIIKRCLLTGYPFRVHKSKAVVRYMFFDAKDIRWFKPVELSTKGGLRGHIVEPLGTHGHMKCCFSSRILQSDTVCMALYKRVYPKWFPVSWGGEEHAAPEDHPPSTLLTPTA